MTTRIAGIPLAAWAVFAFAGMFLFLACLGADYVSPSQNERVDVASDVPIPPDEPGLQPTPTPDTSCANSYISWADVGRRLNIRVAMLGPVSHVTSDENGARLTVGFGPGEHVLVEVVPIALEQFFIPPLSPEEIFLNETVCVLGVVQRIDGRLKIIVNKPADVVLL